MNNITEYTDEMLDEYRNCYYDPIYFIETYCKLQLYDYQKDYITQIHTNQYSLADWSRQTGKTIVPLTYILWFSIFENNKNIVLMGATLKYATFLLQQFNAMLHNLPAWLKPRVLINNRERVQFFNGNKIFTSSRFHNLKGMTISLMYVDEFSAFSNAEEIFDYLPVLSSINGKLIITSSEREDSLFNKLCFDAYYGSSKFVIHHVRWDQVPGRDEKFKHKLIDIIGQKAWDREYESSLFI